MQKCSVCQAGNIVMTGAHVAGVAAEGGELPPYERENGSCDSCGARYWRAYESADEWTLKEDTRSPADE